MASREPADFTPTSVTSPATNGEFIEIYPTQFFALKKLAHL
jgi:hypothetical protein